MPTTPRAVHASVAAERDSAVKMQAVMAGPNRLVISQEALDQFPETKHCDVDILDGRIVLTPAQTIPIEDV